MLLALLSDTHDTHATTSAALTLLKPHNPDAYLHAGDLVSPDMLDLFADLPFHFVYGNNEYDLTLLKSKAAALGLYCHEHFADLTFANKRIAMLHGHEHNRLERLAHSGDYAYLIHGHTHLKRDTRLGPTRIINPGALHRARTKSAALLNLTTDTLTYIDLTPQSF